MSPIIKLSDNAALRIKEIMSNAEKESLGEKRLFISFILKEIYLSKIENHTIVILRFYCFTWPRLLTIFKFQIPC